MKTQKELIDEANRLLRGETQAPTPRKPVPPKAPAPVIEPEPAPVKRRGRPRKSNGTAAKTAG